MATMLAAIYEGPGRISVHEVDRPACTRDGVLVRVEACGLCGTDLRTFRYGHPKVRPPQILGHEIVGVIEEVGLNVTGHSSGQRVAVRPGLYCGSCSACISGMQNFCKSESRGGLGYSQAGGFAQFIHVPGRAVRLGSLMQVPQSADPCETTMFEPLGAVVSAQEMVRPTWRDTLVIVGAGPIGYLHLMLARTCGVSKILLIDQCQSRLQLGRGLEGTTCIEAATENPVARVLEETGGNGADVVIVACSSSLAQRQALEMAAPLGRICFFAGLPQADAQATLDTNLLHYKQFSLFGVASANWRQESAALALVLAGQVDPAALITHRIPLRNIAAGFQAAIAGEGLKTVLMPWL